MTDARPDDDAIETTMLRLVTERGADKTVCPSEVARALGGPHPDGWGPLMQPVRRIAVRLAHAGRIAILRKGKAVDPDDFRGVYRLSLPGSGAGSQSGV
ncbi:MULTISPECIES: DUF3253 domain-containing protein [Methylobacterium]|jgi:hypothetical protein|uniref:DUF3253 domain-containing protein n=2 Tax=Methylobacterium TaxID=407 RepID=A0AAE8HQA7_9HYPH|nr:MULTISPECIES: DUF3253 domain-containing protein [Methylobacterium]KOX44671.1 hypothetical protein ADL19_24900 [Streptomyces purpurogeneiscleroticus]APT31478.1 hypothetical protein MCBMB27_02187 [Methylobacterium phyllosphaerae]AWV17170.1 hypothetical protein A3862_18035 [Methylobacterium sp. XJLW]MBA9061823.1 hypothetical protein [Methylobacterium fujisawaense]MDH3028180.1 DUF3253 domain-containing protein [Methylobacterium fujisawaense]